MQQELIDIISQAAEFQAESKVDSDIVSVAILGAVVGSVSFVCIRKGIDLAARTVNYISMKGYYQKEENHWEYHSLYGIGGIDGKGRATHNYFKNLF